METYKIISGKENIKCDFVKMAYSDLSSITGILQRSIFFSFHVVNSWNKYGVYGGSYFCKGSQLILRIDWTSTIQGDMGHTGHCLIYSPISLK